MPAGIVGESVGVNEKSSGIFQIYIHHARRFANSYQNGLDGTDWSIDINPVHQYHP
jgi:hypothetical protein